MSRLDHGIDLVNIDRFQGIIDRRGQSFLKKVFTDEELDALKEHANPTPHLAARFAAKEATSKALGSGIGATLGFHDIVVRKNKAGKPFIILSSSAAKFFFYPKFYLSITHTKSQAMASVLVKQSFIGRIRSILGL